MASKGKETSKDQKQRLDDFTHTYLSLFSKADFNKVVRYNQFGKLFISLGKGPIAVCCALAVPLDHAVPMLASYPIIYQLPVYALVILGVGRVAQISGTWWQYRLKEQMYVKYKDQMILDKDQVLKLEAEQTRLQLKDKVKKT